jgi:prepilin-type N-terminal cleavage/methylation domain-containing protein
MKGRRGWTMIELLTVLVILGILAGIMVRKYIDLRRTAFAAKIASEFVTIRLAAYNYEADHQNSWPSEAGPGIIPPEMVSYLPTGFTFNNGLYLLDWDNRMPSTDPYGLAISMTTTDDVLMNAVVQNLGNKAPYIVSGNKLTFVLIDKDGNY